MSRGIIYTADSRNTFLEQIFYFLQITPGLLPEPVFWVQDSRLLSRTIPSLLEKTKSENIHFECLLSQYLPINFCQQEILLDIFCNVLGHLENVVKILNYWFGMSDISGLILTRYGFDYWKLATVKFNGCLMACNVNLKP